MSNYNLPQNKAKQFKYRFGWLPDLPDARDHIYEPPLKVGNTSEMPSKMDLREYCSAVQDQGPLGSCTAHALLAAFECCKMKQGVKTKRLSRLFLYYNERVMMNTVMSDSGAYLRDGIKSLNKLGVCFEKDWKYSKSTKPGAKFTKEPPKKCYEDALNNQVLSYKSITTPYLYNLRLCLADGHPIVFGFSVYESFMSDEVRRTGIMPMPEKGEELIGGHAVMAAGYDNDTRKFLIRNSWGKDWGDNGYFWMPYDYVSRTNNCNDFWTIKLVE